MSMMIVTSILFLDLDQARMGFEASILAFLGNDGILPIMKRHLLNC